MDLESLLKTACPAAIYDADEWLPSKELTHRFRRMGLTPYAMKQPSDEGHWELELGLYLTGKKKMPAFCPFPSSVIHTNPTGHTFRTLIPYGVDAKPRNADYAWVQLCVIVQERCLLRTLQRFTTDNKEAFLDINGL